jgi:glycosyltransferase involved in cell wall biosynthesis
MTPQVSFLDHYNEGRIYQAGAKKVIALVSHEDSFTGAPLYLRQLANYLRSLGHKVIILCLRANYRSGVFSSDGFETIYIEDLSTEEIIQRDWILSELGKKVTRDLLVHLSPDQIWVNSINASCFVELAVDSGITVCLFVHESFGFSSSKFLSNDYEVMFYNALQNAGLVVFGSEYSKASFSRPGLTPNSLVLNSIKTIDPQSSEIDLGVRNSKRTELGISEKAWVFLSMATFESRKRIHDIVSAFKLMQMPEACLILVGQVADSEYSDLIVKQAEESGNIFVFPVTQNPSKFYSISDTLVMASEAETYPLVLQEAIHWNLSRIVARFPGYEASCNEENSYLFNVGDIQHLQALMISSTRSNALGDKRTQLAKLDFLEKSKIYVGHLDRILETLSVVEVSLWAQDE